MSHWKIIRGTEGSFYYLTATIVEWTHVFTSDEYFQIVIGSLQYCQDEKQLRVAGYVIMPNHVHLICAGSEQRRLIDTLRDFKQFTAKEIVGNLKRDSRQNELKTFQRAARRDGKGHKHKVWIEGNHPILLDNEDIFRVKLNYVHENPVKKGFVERPEHWKYSSARNYVSDDHSILRVECLM